MKKLMTSAIILLPLLILAIMLVSGAIMSIVTHIFVESVEFVENSALVLEMDDETSPPTEQLLVTILPLKANNRELLYTVEDDGIVTVDENGVVTAKGFGETYVTVTSRENKAASAMRKIIVTDDNVHSIVLGDCETTLYQGDEPFRLSVEVLPEGATDKRVSYLCSDPSVLSVSQTGEVKCLQKGRATVTVSSVENPDIKASVAFECHLPLRHISANTTPVETAKNTARFPAIIAEPQDATFTVSYSSSDESLAAVDGEGEITFLRAGTAVITATAEDGRGNKDSVSVRYTCTDGYYVGRLFGQTEYSFDYDLYAGKELPALAFRSDLEGSYREIQSVECKGCDLIQYHDEGQFFTLKEVEDTTPLGTVEITVHAIKYDRASGDMMSFDVDVCTVEITRETETLSFIGKNEEISSLSVTSRTFNLFEVKELHAEGGIGVLATPVNHTDALSFSIEGDCAALEGETVRFSSEGKAVVTVTAESGASARLEIEYTALKASDKTVELGEEQSEHYLPLSFESETACENGVLQFAVPDGYVAVVQSNREDVLSVEEKRLVPHKGGFADVTVTFRPVARTAYAPDGTASYTVHVYVDKAVEADDVTFSVAGAPVLSGTPFVTSKKSVRLTVNISAKNGELAGKEVCLGNDVRIEGDDNSDGQGSFTFEEEVVFDGAQTLSRTVTVRYGEGAAAYGDKTGVLLSSDCRLRSTDGKIEEGLSVNLEGAPFGDDNKTIAFSDLGDTVELTVEVSNPTPADFVLEDKAISFYQSNIFDTHVDISENIATLTLTSLNGTYKEEQATLSVAGKSFVFSVTSDVLADTLKVEYENTVLEEKEYATYLPLLTFTVTPSRTGHELTSAGKAVRYTFGGEGKEAQSSDVNKKTFSFSVSPADATELKIESGTASFSITVEKKELNALDFEFNIVYTDNGGEVPLGPFSFEEERADAIFPKDMHGSFDIEISPNGGGKTVLGGLYEEDAKAFFTLDEKADWTVSFGMTGLVAKFTVTPPKSLQSFAGETITLHGGDRSVVCSLARVDLQSVEFPGFNSEDTSSGGDVYKGYQQVRVFAKHSDYAVNGENSTVDYFRLPVLAFSNLVRKTPAEKDAVCWTLTRVNDKTKEREVLVSQIGTTVTYLPNGAKKVYTVVPSDGGCSKLLCGEEVIAQNGTFVGEKIPWVDVFAEENYAHLYFGNFGGLSEVDIQNDYFGNFGEQKEWTPTEQSVTDAAKEGSGRDFTPSANAYCYLRVEAGDGAENSRASAHYNFNILEDDALVNIFNATGYYAHNKIVLQSDLYGEGELGTEGETFDKATKNGLFLTKSANLNKTLLYGNGCQVNCEALNEEIATDLKNNPSKYSNGFNESSGVTFTKAYNAVIKCANPSETLNGKTQTIVLKMSYAYYCDLSYYYKFNPVGNTFYTKNTVFSYIPKAAVQLYYDNLSMYAENIVMTECGTSVQADNASGQKIKIYYKGSIDILNYFNQPALSTLNSLIGSFFDMVIPSVKEYFEWHGENMSADAQLGGTNVDKIYVDVLAFAVSDLSSKTYIWTDEGYKTLAEGGGTLSGEAKIVSKNLMFSYYALTYETMKDGTRLDNATVNLSGTKFTGKADMDSLFSTNRYIRLQCEFKEPGVKNYDHIQWHKNTVYRDQSLLGERKSHTEDLRDSLKGTQWSDGSGVDASGIPYEAAQVSAMIAQTVLPSKRSY